MRSVVRVERSEKIDTQALLGGDPGEANGTERLTRIRERERVLAYWPEDLLRLAERESPPWRLLLDPTAWRDVHQGDVHAFVRNHRARWGGGWPSIDETRRRFGRVGNHRGGSAEERGQASFL